MPLAKIELVARIEYVDGLAADYLRHFNFIGCATMAAKDVRLEFKREPRGIDCTAR